MLATFPVSALERLFKIRFPHLGISHDERIDHDSHVTGVLVAAPVAGDTLDTVASFFALEELSCLRTADHK